MRTNINLDAALVGEAMRLTGVRTKREAVDRALRELVFEAAAGLYAQALRQGVTIRTAVDCLVAQLAIEHQAVLVHNDRDYLALARTGPRLRIFPAGALH
ncbi:type II toxin-antitoxin system VapB family antitoxin [Xylophilus sp.]|uniref:type II toxin-antitoxin system VapB family antitoxin n=1 Tax=Xylophilus sp. TaxID=2653893 RepID=UPI002D800728|nr:type II toxin-antitoxin system VapB family antitoxin [Xylophilus sp.]